MDELAHQNHQDSRGRLLLGGLCRPLQGSVASPQHCGQQHNESGPANDSGVTKDRNEEIAYGVRALSIGAHLVQKATVARSPRWVTAREVKHGLTNSHTYPGMLAKCIPGAFRLGSAVARR